MIVVEIGIGGGSPCGWAYQPRRDSDQPGKPVVGSVQDTSNRTILYATNVLLESLGNAKPAHCGVIGVDGVHVIIRASQLYLINGIIRPYVAPANQDLWDILHETASHRAAEGFVIRWQHMPVADLVREAAARAATECIPVLLDSANSLADATKPAPWEEA